VTREDVIEHAVKIARSDGDTVTKAKKIHALVSRAESAGVDVELEAVLEETKRRTSEDPL